MEKILRKHKEFWSQKQWRLSVIVGVLMLFLGFFINYYANVYANLRANNSVSDIILDNIPVFNVNFVFFEGAFLFWVFVGALLAHEPKKIPFILKSVAVFMLIRSVFIMMTHVATPPNHSFLDPEKFFLYITGGNDMFFSSHTGLPFLMALEFWENKILRNVFLVCTFIFGLSVLLGHLHYSIDVFAALFIAFGIFHISIKLFPFDYRLFMKN